MLTWFEYLGIIVEDQKAIQINFQTIPAINSNLKTRVKIMLQPSQIAKDLQVMPPVEDKGDYKSL